MSFFFSLTGNHTIFLDWLIYAQIPFNNSTLDYNTSLLKHTVAFPFLFKDYMTYLGVSVVTASGLVLASQNVTTRDGAYIDIEQSYSDIGKPLFISVQGGGCTRSSYKCSGIGKKNICLLFFVSDLDCISNV